MTSKSSFDIQEFLPYLLNQAAEKSSVRFQKYYRDRYGMLRTEWRVVFHLGRYGPMTAKEICERGSLHKTKISRAVAALEEKRFLVRKEIAADRRHENLSLTKQGTAAFDDLTREASVFDQQLLATFSVEEAAMLRQCLVKIAQS